MTTWHTSETIRDEWEDADQVPDATLTQLVVAARDAVIAYAPPLPALGEGEDEDDREDVPERYRLAQLIQVRNLWNATMTTASGDLGGDTFQITPRPLDWHVKALLRPAQGRPRVR